MRRLLLGLQDWDNYLEVSQNEVELLDDPEGISALYWRWAKCWRLIWGISTMLKSVTRLRSIRIKSVSKPYGPLDESIANNNHGQKWHLYSRWSLSAGLTTIRP